MFTVFRFLLSAHLKPSFLPRRVEEPLLPGVLPESVQGDRHPSPGFPTSSLRYLRRRSPARTGPDPTTDTPSFFHRVLLTSRSSICVPGVVTGTPYSIQKRTGGKRGKGKKYSRVFSSGESSLGGTLSSYTEAKRSREERDSKGVTDRNPCPFQVWSDTPVGVG